MQFIRLPKAIGIAERVVQEPVVDWVETWSGHSLNICIFQQLRINMLVSWVIEWSQCWMPHWRTFRTCTHQAWAIRDLSTNELFCTIPDPGSQQRVTLSLESICTIPFQARASDVKIPELRQHSSNHVLPCFINVFGTFRGIWDKSDNNPGAHFGCLADIFSNIPNG